MKYFFTGTRILTMILLSAVCAYSQEKSPTQKRNTAFVAYPFAYYSPETRAGLGAAGTLNFRWNQTDSISPASQISLGVSTTQNKQGMFSVPFAFYFDKRKHSILGEFSYYDFSYNFYGTGSGNFKGDFEKYSVSYPLFRINYLRKIRPHVFAGARWWYEHYSISSFGGNPIQDKPVAGSSGSRTSGPGLVFLFDSRDNIYYSKRGLYLELSYQNQAKVWGSNFYYDRYRFDLRHFLPLNTTWSLASQLFGDWVKGDVPFNQMPGLGAGKRGRGYYEGRYRDKMILMYQGEFRGMLNERWGTTCFWNYSLLAPSPESFSFKNGHAAVGGGLRFAFDKNNKTNLRLDVAFPLSGNAYIYHPDDAMKIYFTVNEAF